ncbi:MAG: tetratricopeptide repeat protein [Planctomycetes bacterium]|nr:tetratricopeptide repeat protein [Planctomycetota bacterium]
MRQLWQLPTLAVGGLLLAAGLAVVIMRTPKQEFAPHLDSATKLINKGEAEPALELLNSKVLPYVAKGKLTQQDRGRFHQLVGRAVFVGQQAKGIERSENYQTVVTQYAEAEKAKATLEVTDQVALAEALAGIGQTEAALERADRLPADAAKQRVELYRRMIDRSLKASGSDLSKVMDLLSRLLADGELATEDRLWAVTRQAQVQIREGFPDIAIMRILKEMPRLTNTPSVDLGEVYLLLGKAYFDTDNIPEADKQFARAVERIAESDERAAEVQLMLGRIAALKGDLADARDRFELVVAKYEDSASAEFALLGLGEVEATRGETARSIESYERLARRVTRADRKSVGAQITRDQISESLLARVQERREAGELSSALNYASTAELLFPRTELPQQVLLALATSHRALADEAIKGAGSDPLALELSLDMATMREAQAHHLASGQYYKEHRDRVVLTDVKQYGESLWMAADSLDRAGDQESAIELFKEHLQSFAGDPKSAEAKYRLARALQSRGDYETAAKIFRELIDSRVPPAGQPNSGVFGDMSHVPLAQALLADGDEKNDAEAEANLLAACSGTVGGPLTPIFRDAIFELGTFYYRSNQYAKAIERLSEADERYADDPRIDIARFRLADSHRLSARGEQELLSHPMPESDRQLAEARKRDHLTRALAEYDQVLAALEGRDSRRRSGLEELTLRNTWFYLGDVAYDLGDYEQAIRRYDSARERYGKEPAALVAMTQIVSCYLKLGDVARAATVNNRAKSFYKSLPESAWEDPNLPMTRKDWERWLDAAEELMRVSAVAGSEKENEPPGR